MLRTLAERMSRGREFRWRLPQACGGCWMYITPECGLRYWTGTLLAGNLLRSAAETVRPGSVVWDVGANMGLFTMAAAGMAGPTGRVYAFEPDTTLVELLRRSVRINREIASVQVIPCALSDSISVSRFFVARRSRATNYLEGAGSTQTRGIRETQAALTVTLDWLAEQIPPPDVLKIDVEAAESEVFRGAARLIESKRPTLIFESTEENRPGISEWLLKLGYTLYDSDLPADKRQPLPAGAYNTLAVPA